MGGFRVFSIGGIPISIDFMYLILILWWLQSGLESGLLWGACVTVSLIVHELGHALVARRYRLQPRILLWGLGGLCMHERAERDRHDAAIVAAGPAAGLLFGGLVFLGSLALPPSSGEEHRALGLANRGVFMLLYINVFWSLVNLLPLWPLDGGQLFRLGLIQVLPPRLAERITHVVSLCLVAGALVIAYLLGEWFIGLLAGLAAWQNIRALRGDISSGAYRPVNKGAIELVKRAREAYAAADYREAARVCHQIRSLDTPPEAVMKETWALLGASTARLGEHEDALRFLGRAPITEDVVEARIECYAQLGREEELSRLLASRDFLRLPEARRKEILEALER